MSSPTCTRRLNAISASHFICRQYRISSFKQIQVFKQLRPKGMLAKRNPGLPS